MSEENDCGMIATTIHCPNCGQQVPAKDINIVALMAKCAGCDHVFSIDGSNAAMAESESTPSRPSGITHDTGYSGELILKRQWFHIALLGLLFFCIAWDSFLVVWYSITILGALNGKGFDWIMIVFPVGHVAVGVGLTYYVIAGLFNKTTIHLDFDALSVTHGPIPWRGSKRLRREEILELEVEIGSIRSRGMNVGPPHMTISAHHKDGHQVVLLRAIPSPQAEYILWHLADDLKVKVVRHDRRLSFHS